MPLLFILITNISKYFLKAWVLPCYVWCWILLRCRLFFLFHKVNAHALSSSRKRGTKRKQGKLICDSIFHTVIAQRTWITINLSCLKCRSHKSLSGFQKTWCTTRKIKKKLSSSLVFLLLLCHFSLITFFSIKIITLLGNIQQRKKRERLQIFYSAIVIIEANIYVQRIANVGNWGGGSKSKDINL